MLQMPGCWRKGTFLHPWCHLLISGTRHDSHPLVFKGKPLCKALLEAGLQAGLTQKTVASTLNVSLKTFQNWERGLTAPTKSSWVAIKSFLNPCQATLVSELTSDNRLAIDSGDITGAVASLTENEPAVLR